MTDYDYPPGGEKARGRGCTCPVLDNAHGKGYAGNGERYWLDMECPLHGEQ